VFVGDNESRMRYSAVVLKIGMYEISDLTSGKSMNPKLFLNNLQFSNEICKYISVSLMVYLHIR
jgi:hypothetical protein